MDGKDSDLRPHSSRNMNKPSNGFGEELKKHMDTEIDDLDLDQESTDSLAGLFPSHMLDKKTV